MAKALTGPVICGVDFSEASKRALTTAASLAARLNVPLEAVFAADPLLAEAADLDEADGTFVSAATRDLERLVRQAAAGRTVPSVGAIAIQGRAAVVLTARAADRHASLLVVGTEGLGRARRWLLGSTTLGVVRKGSVPVLAVPAPVDAHPAEGAEVGAFVVGVDGSDAARRAAIAAAALGGRLGIPVRLLHAVDTAPWPTAWEVMTQPPASALVARARARMQGVYGRLDPPLDVDVAEGVAADVLTAAASATPGAWVVVGESGEAGHRPGTTALRVLADARVPVLVV